MMNFLMVLIVLVIVVVLIWKYRKTPLAITSIPFGPTGDDALDHDSLESQYPLSDTDLQRLDPDNIEVFNQDQIDQIYARISSGPIPDGPYRGSFFFAEGSQYRDIADVIGGLRGMGIDMNLDLVTALGEMFWQGKVFYRDRLELRNIIDKELIMS